MTRSRPGNAKVNAYSNLNFLPALSLQRDLNLSPPTMPLTPQSTVPRSLFIAPGSARSSSSPEHSQGNQSTDLGSLADLHFLAQAASSAESLSPELSAMKAPERGSGVSTTSDVTTERIAGSVLHSQHTREGPASAANPNIAGASQSFMCWPRFGVLPYPSAEEQRRVVYPSPWLPPTHATFSSASSFFNGSPALPSPLTFGYSAVPTSLSLSLSFL